MELIESHSVFRTRPKDRVKSTFNKVIFTSDFLLHFIVKLSYSL